MCVFLFSCKIFSVHSFELVIAVAILVEFQSSKRDKLEQRERMKCHSRSLRALSSARFSEAAEGLFEKQMFMV